MVDGFCVPVVGAVNFSRNTVWWHRRACCTYSRFPAKKVCMNEPRQNLLVIRVAAVGWLLGWFIKIPFYAPYLLDLTQRYPLEHPLFPVFFEHPAVAQFGYFLPLIFFPALLSSNPAVYQGMVVAMGACSLILLGDDRLCDISSTRTRWGCLPRAVNGYEMS